MCTSERVRRKPLAPKSAETLFEYVIRHETQCQPIPRIARAEAAAFRLGLSCRCGRARRPYDRLYPASGRGVKSCRYWFQALTFTGLDSQATHWKLNVAVVNPNSHEVSLTRMHYALMYQADTLLTGWNPESACWPRGIPN